MAERKNLYTMKLITGYSVTVLIIFFSVFVSISYLTSSQNSRSDSVFIDLKPEPSKNSDYPVYRLVNLQKLPFNVQADLKLESFGNNAYGDNIKNLVFQANFIDKNIIRVKISDKINKQWELNEYNYASMYSHNDYELVLNSYPFGFEVRDKSENLDVFNSIGMNFYFGERYLEIETELDPDSVRIGIGERRGNLVLLNGNYSIWPSIDSQGHHPLFIEIHNKSVSGIFLNNFNAMQLELTTNSLKFKTTGGILDFFILIGKSAEEVIRSFHQITKLPSLPNFSDLGYHYSQPLKDSSELQSLLDFFTKNQIPIDQIWLRNVSKPKQSFELGEEFEDLNRKIKKYNISLILELSSELAKSSKYYDLNKPIYLPYTSNKPQGESVYFDWFAAESSNSWQGILEDLYKNLNYSGLSLINNEVFTGETSNSSNLTIPFKPVNVCLECDTIPLDTVHYNSYTEFDLHSLWSYMQVSVTKSLFLESNKRDSIFSATTRPGIKAFHVFNPAHANWDLFKESITSVINFEIFGIRSGSNICTRKTMNRLDLCLRWHQIAIFFPIMINYKDESMKDSNIFDESILSGIKESLSTRYYLSLFIYSLYFEASLHGGTIVRPMIFEYMELESLNFPYQLMLGSQLLGIFSVNDKNFLVPAYFPHAVWYNLKTGVKEQGKGNTKSIEVFNGFVLYIKGGTSIPIISQKVSRILQVRDQNLTIIIALDKDFNSKGSFYVDDGQSADTISKKKFTKVIISAEKTENLFIKVYHVVNGYMDSFKFIEKIRVLGCSNVSNIKLNKKDTKFTYNQDSLIIDIGLSTYEIIDIVIVFNI